MRQVADQALRLWEGGDYLSRLLNENKETVGVWNDGGQWTLQLWRIVIPMAERAQSHWNLNVRKTASDTVDVQLDIVMGKDRGVLKKRYGLHRLARGR